MATTRIIEGDIGNLTAAAAAGGYVVGFIKASQNGARGTIRGKLFNAGGALVLKVGASVHYYNGSDAHIVENSFTLPIPAGYTYTLEREITSGTCEVEFTTI